MSSGPALSVTDIPLFLTATSAGLHLLVTEGGVDQAGTFRRVGRWDDSRLSGPITHPPGGGPSEF